MPDERFDALIELALSQQLTGWDFSWLSARTREEPLPWDYRALVLERIRGAAALLDVGTGGGEFLAGVLSQSAQAGRLPSELWATEGYPPNVVIARARLEPLGVRLVDVSREAESRLPLNDSAFDLIIDRHEGVPAVELARVLRPGGRYLTQQVGGLNCIDINRALQDRPAYMYAETTLENMLRDLRQAGLRILTAREASTAWTFLDIAGVVFYLQAVPWQIEGFDVETYRGRLFEIHRQIERDGGWTVRQHRLLIEVER